MKKIGDLDVEYQIGGDQVTYTRIGNMPVHYEAAPGGGQRMAYIGNR